MIFPNISAKLDLKGIHLTNRIVMPPMVQWIAPPDASVTDAILAHYKDSRGMGLVIVEATTVAPEGRLSADQIGIYDDRHVEGLRRVAAAIHANHAAAAIQIHHAGRNTRTRTSFFGNPLVAPSAVNPDGEMPRALTEEGIQRIIGCFASAARRALQAGFDAVELHAAHGFLISQFLSPLANHRTDGWGGSLDNRARFLMEIIARIRNETRDAIPCWCRLGAVDGGEGGVTLDEGFEVARWLKAAGMPLIHVSGGIGALPTYAPPGSPFSDRVHLAAMVKQAADIPVIAVGEIRRPEDAERAVAGGLADLVAVGRGILADPLWAEKALSGRVDEIHFCRNCADCRHFDDPSQCPARREAAGGSA